MRLARQRTLSERPEVPGTISKAAPETPDSEPGESTLLWWESEPPPCVLRSQGFCAGSVEGPRGTTRTSPSAHPAPVSRPLFRAVQRRRDRAEAPAGPDGRTRLLGPQECPRRGHRRHAHGAAVFPAGESPLFLRPLLLLLKGPKPTAASRARFPGWCWRRRSSKFGVLGACALPPQP